MPKSCARLAAAAGATEIRLQAAGEGAGRGRGGACSEGRGLYYFERVRGNESFGAYMYKQPKQEGHKWWHKHKTLDLTEQNDQGYILLWLKSQTSQPGSGRG